MTDERTRQGTTAAGFRVLGVAIRREPWIFAVSTLGSVLFGALTVADAWVLGWATDHVVLPAFDDRRGRRRPAGRDPRAVRRRRAPARGRHRRAPARRRRHAVPHAGAQPPRRHPPVPPRCRWSGTSGTRPASCSPTPTPTSRRRGGRSRRCRWRSARVAMMVIAVVQMFLADVVLAIVGLLVFPAVVLANLVYQRRASPLMTRAQQLRAELSEVAHESFDGALVVKTLGRETEETERFADKAHQLRDVNIRAGRIRAAFDPTLEALPNLGVLVVLAVGVARVLDGATDPGDVVTVAYLLTIVSFPIRSIGWLLGEFPRSVVGFHRVRSGARRDRRDAVRRPHDRAARGRRPARGRDAGLPLRPRPAAARRRHVHRRARPHRRGRRRHRLRQEHAHHPADPAGRPRRRPDPARRHRPARPGPGRARARRRRGAADRVPLRRHGARQRHPRRRRLRRGGLGGAARRAGRRLRRGAARTASTPGSGSAAPRCPAASGSGSRWPARWSAGRGCWSSTTRPPRSTPRSRRGSWRRSASGARRHHARRGRLPQGHDRAGRRGGAPRGRPGRRPRHPRRAARARARRTPTWSTPTSTELVGEAE